MTFSDARPAFLLGLIGEGIQKSRTPAMHELEGDSQGLRVLYRLIDLHQLGVGVEALPELLTAAERMGFSGLNITHPCKQAIIPLLHDLSPDARALGAVNTVVLRNGKRFGHNTDCSGFGENFRRGLAGAARDKVAQIGAGGAGAAVSWALLKEGVTELTIVDVDSARAQQLADRLCAAFGAGRAMAGADTAAAVACANGVVNCTPIGMAAHPGSPLDHALLRPDLWVADIVYFPLETELLAQARKIGCRTLSGGGMAVFQAVDAFRLFTGREPDIDRMIRRFDEIGENARGIAA